MKNRWTSRFFSTAAVVRMGMVSIILMGVVSCTHHDAVQQQIQIDRDTISESPSSLNRKYPFANDRMIYIPLEDGELEQWSVEGVYQQKIRLSLEDVPDESDGKTESRGHDDGERTDKAVQDEGDPDEENGEDDWEGSDGEDEDWEESELLWVDNEELIWLVTREEDEEENYIEYDYVYSTPIEQKGDNEVLLTEQTKELFVCKDSGICGAGWEAMRYEPGVYVDDSYIICDSYYDGLIIYNRKQGGEVMQLDQDQYFHFLQSACLTAAISGNQIVCHNGTRKGKIKDDLYGFCSYCLEDQTVHTIDARCFYRAAYVADPVRNKVYYQIAEDQSIWEYDFRTERCQELITEEQFQVCCQQNRLLWEDAYYNDSLYVEGDRIYLVKNRDNPQFFSYDIASGDLAYEEQLTSVVQNSCYSTGEESGLDCYALGNDMEHFLMITEGKLLLYWQSLEEEDLYFLCVDLETAEQKMVTRDDPEKIYFGINGCWVESGTTGKWRPSGQQQEDDAGQQVAESPQEKQAESTEQPKSTPNSSVDRSDQKYEPVKIPIADQLKCISRYADLWMQKDDKDDLTQYYAVTDLDHNGRLELIATSGTQGSGAFTDTHYYQVSADGQNLRPITAAIEMIDIKDGINTAYVDPKTDTYYYLARDYVSAGAGARYCWYGAVVLDNGMLTDRTYAETGTEWDEKKTEEVWYGYYYRNGKTEKMKEDDFDSQKLAAQFFKGFQKKSVYLSWFSVQGKRNQTEQKILEKVTTSYRKFTPK